MSGFRGRFTVWEDGTATLLMRVVGEGGALVTDATVAAVEYGVHDLTDPSEASSYGTRADLTIYDEERFSAMWSDTRRGYNVRHDLTPEQLPEGRREYAVHYRFEMSGGFVLRGEAPITTRRARRTREEAG